jgi:cellulose synthase/poly-beta-1,6-N-acetylglucosamine synthase-like glycosyltransferase
MVDILLTTVFRASLALIIYTYAGYPLLVVAIGMFFPRPRRDPSYRPSVSVMIAAYNEEASIEKKVQETLALDYPADKLEIVIVSDGSSDRTNEIMSAFTHPQVRFFAAPRGGKTNAQNYGVERCIGEIVIFSDATSVYKHDAIRQLVAYFVDPTVGAVSGICRFFEARGGASPTGLGQIVYGGYEQSIRIFQSRIMTATACSGPIYATRRALYVPLAGHACSDMVEPMEIVRRGARVVYAPEALASEASTESASDEFRMRVRVTTQGIHGLLSAGSMLLFSRGFWVTFQLVSHKGVRYLLPLPLILLLLSSALLAVDHASMRWIFAAQAVFYGSALLGLVLPLGRFSKLLNLPLYFCTGNAAVMLSVLEAIRGNQFAVWETVRK